MVGFGIGARGVAALLAGAFAIGLAACAPASVADDVVVSDKASFRVVEVARGLEHPWGMAFLPDGGMLVTERPGRLRLIQDGKLRPEPVAGVPEVYARGQGGLLDIALDPEFDVNQLIYLSYAAPVDGGATTRVMRARYAPEGLREPTVILDAAARGGGGVHFGSRLGFDRDGLLYVTIGERGERDRAQDLGDHAGTIVRLHTDGSVPADNPFVGQPGALPEIYAYGIRSPQGLAFRPTDGQLFELEHGPRGGDEVNLIEPGVNYGWPVITHGRAYSGGSIGEGSAKDGMAQPLRHWVPSIAPSGLTFYDGDAFPAWRGNLFVGALKFELLARLELDGDRIVAEERLLEDRLGRIRDVRQGPDGFLYLLTDEDDGGLYRLEPVDS